MILDCEIKHMNWNPYLRPSDTPQAEVRAGTGYIETPGDTYFNMSWQTRDHDPSEYELQLCETLESIFGEGKYDLEQIVGALQQSNVRLPGGRKWTEESFVAEMRRLGK